MASLYLINASSHSALWLFSSTNKICTDANGQMKQNRKGRQKPGSLFSSGESTLKNLRMLSFMKICKLDIVFDMYCIIELRKCCYRKSVEELPLLNRRNKLVELAKIPILPGTWPSF